MGRTYNRAAALLVTLFYCEEKVTDAVTLLSEKINAVLTPRRRPQTASMRFIV